MIIWRKINLGKREWGIDGGTEKMQVAKKGTTVEL